MYMNDGIKTKINLRNKSVFITGVAGFIGSNLAKRLLSTVEGVKVVGLDNMNHYYDVRLKEARLNEYKIKNQSNETVMIQAFDNTKLVGHYYEREKGAPLIVFFHGLWGHSYLDGVPIYRITQKHNWNLLLCDLRAQGDSEGEFSTLGVLEKYDCLDWVEWAQNRFGDKNPIFLMGVSMGASIVMMSSDLELPDSVYGIIDDCGFTSTLDVIKQNNNKKISKYIQAQYHLVQRFP